MSSLAAALRLRSAGMKAFGLGKVSAFMFGARPHLCRTQLGICRARARMRVCQRECVCVCAWASAREGVSVFPTSAAPGTVTPKSERPFL
jgi:hypothetical protein